MTETRHYSTVIAIPEIDGATVEQARRLFFAYKEKQIIESGLFDDDKWMLTNERDRRGFDFSIDKMAFYNFSSRLNITDEEFKNCLKTFIVYNMGALSLGSLQHIILAAKRTAYSSEKDITVSLKETDAMWINQITDFFSMLPAQGREDAIDGLLKQCDDALEQACLSSSGSQRTLASFESYFRFNEILKRFWEESEDTEEKLFFFPVWLWWNVTGVIPTRPHEFVLTQRNCLELTEGKYFLTVRKNRVKGSNKTKGYRISEDYETAEYQIPERIASEIEWYLNRTEYCRDTSIRTLLVTETHYSMWNRNAPRTSRYYTYTNLRTCLRYFYQKIIRERYGYNVLSDFDGSILPEKNEIEYIHLGDTRHIALINLIAEGASPIAAMILGGHDTPDMSAHYFSNISKLVECRVQRQYRRMIDGVSVYALSKPRSRLCVGEPIPCAYNGLCYSEKAKNHDFSDCYKVIGPAGEIGHCPNCDYYRDGKKGFHDAKELYVNRIETESKVLSEIVKQVRKGHGDTEDILCILNRLNGAAHSFEQYLLETRGIEHGEAENHFR